MEIISFDNMDDMMAHLSRMQEDAEAATLPKQKEIVGGTYFIRPLDEEGFFVFGEAFSLERMEKEEIAAGGEEDEVAEMLDEEKRKQATGLMFGKCYSIVEPTGEYGTTHRATAWPITEGFFLNAKENGWRLTYPNPDGRGDLVHAWAIDLFRQMAGDLWIEATENQINPMIQLGMIVTILSKPGSWGPRPGRPLDEDMQLDRVTDDSPEG